MRILTAHLFLFWALTLLVPVSWTHAAALPAEVLFQKGPYLFYREGRLVIRIEEQDLQAPKLEWRNQLGTGTVVMERVAGEWQGTLPAELKVEDLKYRIVAPDRSTPWIKTAAKSANELSFKFAVYGDNRKGWGGGGHNVHTLLQQYMLKEGLSFVIHAGDLVSKGNQETLWDNFFARGREFLQAMPFLPCKGNHDKSRNNRFATLWPIGTAGKTYYAFEQGGAHFMAIDTTINFRPGSAQYVFIRQTLESWRGKSPIFAYLHHPPFSGGKHGDNGWVQTHLVPLFVANGVDVVFSGHDHNYQRIGPIDGVLYIVTGGGGSPLYRVRPNPNIKAYKVLHHYVLIEVAGNRLKGWMRNDRNAVEDSFEFDHKKLQ